MPAALLLAGLVLAGVAQTAAAAEAPSPGTPPELAALMAHLAQRQHGHIPYTEEHFIGVLDRPLKSSGELFYDAPGRLEKRTLVPKPESAVLDNGTLTVHRGKRTYVAQLADYPQLVPLIDSIRALLAGDLPALERLFSVEWHSGGTQGGGTQWQLRLTPRDPAMAQAVKVLEVRGADGNLQVFEIRQSDGDRSVLTLGAEIPG